MRDDASTGPGRLPAALLDWYDVHARHLPWRVPPGSAEPPDPYRVWLSEVMLQQTTVAAVLPYFAAFTSRWPTVTELAAAPEAEVMAAWAGLGYYARARNLVACARAVADDHGGRFPDDEAGLRALPGIGAYTAAAIAAIAFGRRAVVVDGNVERVMARLFAVTEPLPGARPTLRAHAARLTPAERPGDYAQAVMDLGATICTPKSPDCGACPWQGTCAARAAGNPADLPRRSPKAARPLRRGIAYLGRRRADGAWLLETRPGAGLLGGMLGLPGSDWAETAPAPAPPVAAAWRQAPGEVRHVFTHFELRLTVMVAETGSAAPARGAYLDPAGFDPDDLPTVMRKAFALGRAALEDAGQGRSRGARRASAKGNLPDAG